MPLIARACLLVILLWLPAVRAAAAPCAADASPTIVATQFTSAIKAQRPVDDVQILASSAREVFLHATTRGTGRITYRWFRDGKRVSDVAVNVGSGEWHTWSRVRLPPPLPQEVRVQVLGKDGCLLREMTLAASVLVDDAEIGRAWRQLADGDATGAKITLNTLLESAGKRTAKTRQAERMLSVEVAIAEAGMRVADGGLFLVEPALRAIEKRLGRSSADRSARERIARVRDAAETRRREYRREAGSVAVATRNLFESEKLFRGDYPLLREDAEKLVQPVLAGNGDTWALVDWQPTLRGYRLVLQDRRSGDALEVTSR